MRKLLLPFLVLSILLSSCRSMGSLYSSVYTAPIVKMPAHVKKIGIVNRSLALDNKNKQVLNTIEGILTGEGIMEDKNGSKACLAGAATQINLDSSLRAHVLDNIALAGSGGGILPSPLDSRIIDTLCSSNGFDALLVLEVFDTDQRNSTTTTAINELANLALTGQIAPVQTPSNTGVYIKTTWRLYDGQSNTILDEATLSDYFGVNNYAYDLGDFAKRDAIQTSSYIAGRVYVSRLYPAWIRVNRLYFQRNGPDLKMARRMLQVSDYEGAKRIWAGLVNHPKRKIAGRACYNMAVVKELEGDFQSAMEWIQKSYSVYRIPQARQYANFISNRSNGLIRY